MIKKYIWPISIFFLFFGLYSCDLDANKGKSIKQVSVITVYGSANCMHCVKMKKWLDENNIDYTFFDVNSDREARTEMLNKVKKAKIKGRVLYPVVDIDGRIFIQPDHNTIEGILKK